MQEVALTLQFSHQLSRPCMQFSDLWRLFHMELIVEEDVHPDGGFGCMVDVVAHLFPDTTDQFPLAFAAPASNHHARATALAKVPADLLYLPNHLSMKSMNDNNLFINHNFYFIDIHCFGSLLVRETSGCWKDSLFSSVPFNRLKCGIYFWT